MAIRKLKKSWQYDFTIPGYPRQRKGGFRTKAECEAAERAAREDLVNGVRRVTLLEAYSQYMAAATLKDRTRDSYEFLWTRIEPELAHLQLQEVTTAVLDVFKRRLPDHIGANTVNHHLVVVRALLNFMWKRGVLPNVPYIPMESVPKKLPKWYTQEERDRLLEGIFRLQPRWYLFYYLTTRLGLRVGEIYAIGHRQIRESPPRLLVDQAVQRGNMKRPAKLVGRKNHEAYVLDVTPDVMDAIRWHIEAGYSGPDFLFSLTGEFPRYIDSHVRPLRAVQRKLGLRILSHHAVGRHSVASQAVTSGESIKAIQAQLGHRSEQSTHRYAHLGSGAQLRLVETLTPASPPHVNLTSTDKETGS